MIFQVLSTTTTSTMIVSWRGLSSVKSNRWLENGQQEIIAFLLRRKFVRNYNKFIDVISNANIYLAFQHSIHIKEFSSPKKKYKLTHLLQHNGIFSNVSFLIPLFMGKTSTCHHCICGDIEFKSKKKQTNMDPVEGSRS